MTTYHAKYPSGTEPVKLTYDQSTDLRLILIKKRAVNRDEQKQPKTKSIHVASSNGMGSSESTHKPSGVQSSQYTYTRSGNRRVVSLRVVKLEVWA